MKRKEKKQEPEVKFSIRNLLAALLSMSIVVGTLIMIIFYMYLLVKDGQQPSSNIFTMATQFFGDFLRLFMSE